MAIVIPIVTEYADKGMKSALSEIKRADGAFGKLKASAALVGPALATAGIAAGAFAIKLGVEGVQAAMDEQQELKNLQNTLNGLDFTVPQEQLSSFVDELARGTNFDDTAIRNAFRTIVETAPSAAAAFDTVRVAVDAAEGSGKKLETIQVALAKAAGGNTTALGKLFPFLDKTRLKTEGVDYATKVLAERYAGSAAESADTWAGKLGNVQEAFDELKEAFGQGFLDGLAAATGSESGGGVAGLTEALYDLQEPLGELGTQIGTTAGEIATLTGDVTAVWEAFVKWKGTLEGTPWGRLLDAVGDATLRLLNPLGTVLTALNNVIAGIKELAGMRPSWPNIPSIGPSPGAAATRNGTAAYSSGPVVNVTVQAGVGDPIAIARAVEGVLRSRQIRLGVA